MSNIDEKNWLKGKRKSKLTAAIQWKCINSRKVVMFIRQSEEEEKKNKSKYIHKDREGTEKKRICNARIVNSVYCTQVCCRRKDGDENLLFVSSFNILWIWVHVDIYVSKG